jgi:hypothetical protein
MPEVWTARYTNAGRSLRTDSHSEMMHFFCTQQANADRADFRNESKMKAERKKNKDFDSSKPCGRKKWRPDAKQRLSRQEKKEHNRSLKTKSETKTGSRVDDDDACPVHPGASHTWGECYLNARNKSKSKKNDKDDRKPAASKFKGKPKSKSNDDVDANAMHCCDHSVSSNQSGEIKSSDDEGSVEIPLKVAINDVSMTNNAKSDDGIY